MSAAEGSKRKVGETLTRINRIFREGGWRELESYVADDIVMVFPGFQGRSEGKEAFLAGFRAMAENAKVHEFEESDRQIDVFRDMAVASFAFEVVYQREGRKYKGSGRDFWVFERRGEDWRAVWRTMLEMHEEPMAAGPHPE